MSDLLVKGFSFLIVWLGEEILVTGERIEGGGVFICFYVYSVEFERYIRFHSATNMIIPFTEASLLSFATKTLSNGKEKFALSIKQELSNEAHKQCVARTISDVDFSYHFNFDNYYNPATQKGTPKRRFDMNIQFSKEFQEKILPEELLLFNSGSEGVSVRMNGGKLNVEVRRPQGS